LLRALRPMYQSSGGMTKTLRGALKVLWVACAGFLTNVAVAPGAVAQNSTTASAAVEAKRLFAEGSALYLSARYEAALEALRSSYELVPSPNSQLVIARCLRELGRLVEAQEAFGAAEAEARRRAAEGTVKYKQTTESAAVEGAAVRSALGTIHVRVEGVAADTKLEVDGASTELPADGDLIVWHVPGEVAVSLHSGSGMEQKQTVTVRAGAEVTMGFGRPEPAPPERESTVPARASLPVSPPMAVAEHPQANAPQGPSWASPAAITSGALTAVGAGMFIGFGLASEAAFNNLKTRCGNHCGPADRPDARRGQTDQLIANVSLVAGSLAAAATATFVIIAASSPAPAKTMGPTGWHVVVGATSLEVAAEFR
jgi:hypothetical protein